MSKLKGTAIDLYVCASSWVPDARLVGNVKASEIRTLCERIIYPESSAVYIIFDQDGNMLETTMRRSADKCWKDFEDNKKICRSLLQRDDYGYSCKKRYISKQP